MNRVRSERELYRILQQLGLLDGDGRASPDTFDKIRLLTRCQHGLRKTRLAAEALTLMAGSVSREDSRTTELWSSAT